MKFSIYKTLLLLTVLFLSSQSKADSAIDATGKIYLQAGYSSLNINYGNYSYNIGSTYTAYLGGNLNKYFGLELLGATTSTTDYSTTLNFDGIFIKPKYALNDYVEIFARMGLNEVNLSTSYAGRYTGSYLAYGGGINVYFTDDKKQYIQLDYMNWAHNNGYSLSGGGLSYGYKF